MPTVHLIDASPYVFRSYFSLPASIRDPEGAPMNAVYGFASFLLKYSGEEKPTHAAVAFDRSLTTSFRNEIYPEYKQQRALPPPELEAQLRYCEKAARVLGFATFADETYEADDLIATIIDRLDQRDRQFVIVSPDKDLAQLVSDTTLLYDYARKKRLGPDEVESKMGVRPSQVPDFLGLAGDAVDNIPGVRGIGPKTAAMLLGIYGSIEKMLEEIASVSTCGLRGARSIEAKLREEKETALLSRRLATVSTDAPVSVALGDLKYRGPSSEAERTFREWGFGTIIQRMVARDQ